MIDTPSSRHTHFNDVTGATGALEQRLQCRAKETVDLDLQIACRILYDAEGYAGQQGNRNA